MGTRRVWEQGESGNKGLGTRRVEGLGTRLGTCMHVFLLLFPGLSAPLQTAEALIHLKDAEAFPSDSDDRRYVLQVTHPSLKK